MNERDGVGELRRELEAARGEAAAMALRLSAAESRALELEQEGEALRAGASAAEAARLATVGRYREVVLARHPELPEELVSGDSVETVDAAVTSALALVEKIRQRPGAGPLLAHVIPSISPARRAPDLSALSAGEKIRQGLAQRR